MEIIEFPNSTPEKSTVKNWYTKFKRSEITTEDAECRGRPKETVTDKNLKKVHKIILPYMTGK